MNELIEGRHRIGQLYDGDPDSPPVDVILRRESTGIYLEVPWNSGSQVYGQWFKDNGDESGNTMPTTLSFVDAHGAVLLVGCRSLGYSTNLRSGQGTVAVEYAVLGPHGSDYQLVNRLRWEVSGLRRWMGRTSITEIRFKDHPYRKQITIEPAERFDIPGYPGVAFIPRTWWRHTTDDIREAHDILWVETISGEPSRWKEHEAIPRKLRDLLAISRWQTETYKLREALRDDDVYLHPRTGESLGLNWREVVTESSWEKPVSRSFKQDLRDLIQFDDLGLEGLPHWFALCDEYHRVIDPVVSQTIVRDAHPLARLSHTGPAVEALGYLLLLEDGMPGDKAARSYLRARTERIASELDGVLPFDVASWAEPMPDTYNGLKHANREDPNQIDVLNAWGQSLMMIRAWIALRLGVERDTLERRLRLDRQPYEFLELDLA